MQSQAAEKALPVQEKHFDLDGAISCLNGVISKAAALKDRIHPVPQDIGSGKDESAPPTLYELLNGGGERVRCSCDKLHKLLNDIEELLF